MKKWLLPLICSCLLTLSCQQYRTGDLLFVGGKEDMDHAISDATGSITHVAILVRMNHSLWVWDATPSQGVRKTPYTEFLTQLAPNDTLIARRIQKPFSQRHLLSVLQQVEGTAYDSAFCEGNGNRYYCSELVKTAFIDRTTLQPLFDSQPMNWRDADGVLPRYWTDWFARLGIPVPEGEPGTNPNDMFHASILKSIKLNNN